jgi:hypothetical protein
VTGRTIFEDRSLVPKEIVNNPDLYERNRGRSKIHPGIILEALIGVLRLRFTRTRR